MRATHPRHALRFLVFTSGLIFAGEALIRLIPGLVDAPHLPRVLLDAALLVAIVLPILYLGFFRSLVNESSRSQRLLDERDALEAVAKTYVGVIDANDRLQRCNRPWSELFGPDQAVGGDRFGDWVLPADRDILTHALFQARAGFDVDETEVRVQDAGGRLRTVAWTFHGLSTGELHVSGHDLTDHRNLLHFIDGLVEGLSSRTGDDFLQALVTALGDLLDVDLVIVSSIRDEAQEAETLAVWSEGQIVDNFTYGLNGTPCEEVTHARLCVIEDGVTERFPTDAELSRRRARGYLGAPLLGPAGRAIGMLTLVSRRPLAEPQRMAGAVRVFANRAAAELARLYVQRDLLQANASLQATSERLELEVAERTDHLRRANAEIHRELRERKNAEGRLQHHARRMEVISNNVHDLITEIAATGCITYSNAAWSDLLGYAPGEPLGMSVSDLLPPEELEAVMTALNEAIRQPGSVRRRQHRLRCQDGGWRWFDSAGAAYISPDGQMTVVALSRDVQALKQVERDREQLIVELRDALTKVRTLSGLLPICSSCKQIRDEAGDWNPLESYVKANSAADFTHSFCPDCSNRLVDEHVTLA